MRVFFLPSYLICLGTTIFVILLMLNGVFFSARQFCAFKSLAISFLNSNFFKIFFYLMFFFEVLIYDPYYVDLKM
jgi:hypothetical protein